MLPEWVLEKIALLVPLIASLTVHEVAHARTALAFGDPTAKNMGRCSLNPLVHLDPVGTLAVLFCGFGWAKPVPVNPYNLHPQKWGNIAVSVAGPLSNLVLGILLVFVLRGLLRWGIVFSSETAKVAWGVLRFTMLVNFVLFAFNMMPLFPLDGHHILREQLSPDKQAGFMRWQMQYGRFILMILIIGPIIGKMLGFPVISPLGWVFANLDSFVMDHLVW